jgi:hypothetical protein
VNNVPGHRAHGGGLEEMLFRRILRGSDRPVGRIHAGTPHGIRAIVMRAYHLLFLTSCGLDRQSGDSSHSSRPETAEKPRLNSKSRNGGSKRIVGTRP